MLIELDLIYRTCTRTLRKTITDLQLNPTESPSFLTSAAECPCTDRPAHRLKSLRTRLSTAPRSGAQSSPRDVAEAGQKLVPSPEDVTSFNSSAEPDVPVGDLSQRSGEAVGRSQDYDPRDRAHREREVSNGRADQRAVGVFTLMTHTAVTIALSTGLVGYVSFHYLEPRRLSFIVFLLIGLPVSTCIAFAGVAVVPLSVRTFLLILVVHLAVIASSTVVYRLSPFHPLYRYPGPVVCRITRLWAWRKVAGGYQHRYYRALHQRYGPIVRTGPNHLHICDAKAVNALFSVNTAFRKSERYIVANPPTSLGSLLSLSDPQAHSRRRRLWEPAFTASSLKEYEGMLNNRVSQLVRALDKRKGGSVNLADWLSFMAFDFMGDFAFDGLFNLLQAGEDKAKLMQSIGDGLRFQELLGTIPWIRDFYHLFAPSSSSAKRFYKAGADVLQARMARGQTTKGLFYYILGENDERAGSTQLQFPTLVSEATLAVAAGSDTTGTALSNAFYYLVTHPEAYRRLRTEIDSVAPRETEILDPSTLVNLPYLHAVINETLRLAPAIPNGVQRILPRTEQPKLIGEYLVPPGTSVQVSTYTIHRDPRYVAPHPEEFKPERWLKDNKWSQDKDFRLVREVFMPFSVGPTNCVGKSLAMMELRTVIGTLVHKYNFRLDEARWSQAEWDKASRDGFALRKGALPVIVEATL
ncbi:cytochrome P450 [Punctularia strigosozonata HHB-11173 SS5]|uniref:cytochrome P450 n=1 Tax=Punctularia strigosozonata (strain HHB-11173) TaxID=741275 RepID=UPI00044175A3|nr:cytochrome P450 [Punctularia strigosozonata HHB-11173 SS5]EIN14547.1 cytochrome P450 [Punctularia strigosozonata HHB-11173 SS5]